MNIKAIIAVFIYYLILGGIYHFGVGYLGDSTTTLNESAVDTTPPVDYSEGGILDYFVSMGKAIGDVSKTLGFMFFAIGLPSDMPVWMAWFLHGLFILIFVICIAIIVNSFWGGGG